jgi:hypothetical protein
MFKKLSRIIELYLLELENKLKTLNELSSKEGIVRQYNIETGEKFNDIINRYAISEDELLSISETVARFVTYTRKTNIDKYLFIDEEKQIPRLRV